MPDGVGNSCFRVLRHEKLVIEVIAEGGIRSVCRARQTEPVERFVAVKLIKTGMNSKQVLARFEADGRRCR